MATQTLHAWKLGAKQHGIITRRQLLALGFTAEAIRHRVAERRLHPVHRGVYAVGRPELDRLGVWMGAVLCCGEAAALSHSSAAEFWGFGSERDRVEVSVPVTARVCRPGIMVHRSRFLQRVRSRGIPVTTPICTLMDVATDLPGDKLEEAVNKADSLRVVRVDTLRTALARAGRRPGAGRLRKLLDRRTFVLTDSHLERLFLRLVREAGLPPPLTQVWLNGFRVDFHWPELGLVVETDGLTSHRTPAQQSSDRRRDQAHAAAGLTTLRFTHAQVRFEPEHVIATLRAVAERFRRAPA